MKKCAKDISWPPLGVRDLKPDGTAKKETMKFDNLKQALLKKVHSFKR